MLVTTVETKTKGPQGSWNIRLGNIKLKTNKCRGSWMAQLVKHLTLAQVMTSWFESSSPMLGSVLTAQSLEPASCSMAPSLFAPLPLMLSLKNKH